MSDIAIKIENLSKQYRLGVVGTGTLSHDLKRWWAVSVMRGEDPYLKIGEANVQHSKGHSEYVWALKDINLEVKQGEVLGIIGKNGAGKSTLLKILSRVTRPTGGTISYKGRIASLLEVGTGFHPEMTGRENIYMNGSIMGMTRAEIRRKFDEIVDFAGVERYIDTPVKRYSSGMTVRLGFAIAAHLEPEILVVDEVLAVGDAEFQKKALGKMQDVSHQEGRTVLFVSHNMQAITSLCGRAILLQNGRIIENDDSFNVVSKYLMNSRENNGEILFNDENALGDSMFQLKAIRILDQNNLITSSFFSKSKIRVQFEFELLHLDDSLVIGFDLIDENGVVLMRSYQNDSSKSNWPKLKIGNNIIFCDLPGELLNFGTYFICPKVSLHCIKWIINSGPLLSFHVELNHGDSPFWNILDKSNRPGILALIIPWSN